MGPRLAREGDARLHDWCMSVLTLNIFVGRAVVSMILVRMGSLEPGEVSTLVFPF